MKSFCTAKEIIRLKDNPQNGRKNTIGKQNNWQRINLQDIQAARAAQKQKTQSKNGRMT